MDNVLLNQNIHFKCGLILICATAYGKINDNRVIWQSLKYFKRFFYIFYHINLNLVNMDNVISNQNIQFECSFSVDLCDGLQ